MKKAWKKLLALSLALWLLAAGSVQATEDASMAAHFQQEGQYYGFTVLESWPSALKGELRSSGLALALPLGPVKLADSGLPVAYMLLVDSSGSMKRAGSWVTRFITALEEADDTGARFLLATFGEAFSLEWDGQEGSAAGAAEKIAYTAQKTDVSQGVLDAVDYLRSARREPGELMNLVVISDGMPDESGDSPALSEVARLLAEERSILVHTVGLEVDRRGSREALETLETLGRGAHLVGSESRSAGTSGEALAGFVNSLCAVSFPWKAQNAGGTELFLSWEDGGELSIPLDMSGVPVLENPEDGEGGEEPATPPADPEDPEHPKDPETPEDPDGASASSVPDVGEDPHPPAGKTWMVWAAWAGGGAALLLLLLLALLLRRRRRRPAQPPKGSVYMRVEVLSGAYAGPEELYLASELIVGRGRRCDIPWKDKGVAVRNSRIFLRDNLIYIEDLNSPQGTALGGMRLYSPNRLRSGDEISAGPVRFRLKF